MHEVDFIFNNVKGGLKHKNKTSKKAAIFQWEDHEMHLKALRNGQL